MLRDARQPAFPWPSAPAAVGDGGGRDAEGRVRFFCRRADEVSRRRVLAAGQSPTGARCFPTVHTTRPASELALELCQQLRVREVILAPISNSPDGNSPGGLDMPVVLANRFAMSSRSTGSSPRSTNFIDDRFSEHRLAPVITSMVGIGDLLGAEFLAAAGDVRTRFESADHLAGYAGLAPIPRDSHTRSGNLHRPRRYNRQLQRVFYTSAISIQHSIASRAFYDRKRPKANDTRKQ